MQKIQIRFVGCVFDIFLTTLIDYRDANNTASEHVFLGLLRCCYAINNKDAMLSLVLLISLSDDETNP